MFLVVRDILFLAPRFNHGFLHVSPGATEKGREITPPEGSGSPNTHKRHLGSLSDSPRSDSDPKPNTSKGKAREMAPEDRENVLSSPLSKEAPSRLPGNDAARSRILLLMILNQKGQKERQKRRKQVTKTGRVTHPSKERLGRMQRLITCSRG